MAFFIYWFIAAAIHGLYDFLLFSERILFFIFFFLIIARVWVTIINNCLNNSPKFKYDGRFQTRPIQFFVVFALTSILMFEYVLVGFLAGPTKANAALSASAFSGSFLIMFLGSKLTSINLVKTHWARFNISINPFTDDEVSQNFIGQIVYFDSYYADRGLIEVFENGVKGKIIGREVLRKRKPTKLFSYHDPEWFIVKLSEKINLPEYNEQYAIIKFKETHSSLNAKKFFLVDFRLIPKKRRGKYKLVEDFDSLGWVFTRTEKEKKLMIQD